MENVIPIIIVLIIVIVKVVRAVQEQKQSGSGNGDGWWEDETGNRPATGGSQTSPARTAPGGEERKPRPEPSGHVREILRQLQQQAQPRPTPVPARRYLDETTLEEDLTHAARQSVSEATGYVYEQSLQAAFPKTGTRALRISGAKQRPPIRVRACGRANLRRAILISEILGPPRAFDV